MQPSEYLQAYDNYFWQWEDNGEVIAIPGHNTIAYRQLITETIGLLAMQGLPPFGALLAVMAATNSEGQTAVDAIYLLVKNKVKEEEMTRLDNAIGFLNMLTELPVKYKEGNNRKLMLQAIFQGAHHRLSPDESAIVHAAMQSDAAGQFSKTIAINSSGTYNDLRCLDNLSIKFPTTGKVLEAMAALPVLPELLPAETEEQPINDDRPDLITQLINNSITFNVGVLIKRIWAGLDIPVHSILPSEQPLGGVSDISNKGSFDKLLITEFANDDVVFMSRLANNEALYLQRETPPANNKLQRVILIDVSLKTWGTSKAIAFAIMLAVARHPKTDIECRAFAVGQSYRLIQTSSIDDIISSLQVLEPALHAANGLNAFFKDFPSGKNREVIVITEPTTLQHIAMQKLQADHHKLISYWVYADSQGNIDLYKKNQAGRKHMQHLQLPLKELWKKQLAVMTKRTETGFPLLFAVKIKSNRLLVLDDGTIFLVTNSKAVFKAFNTMAERPDSKGWELIRENVPITGDGEIAIGKMTNRDHILLCHNRHMKQVTLMNIISGEKKSIIYDYWDPLFPKFVFHEDRFYNGNKARFFSIDEEGSVREAAQDVSAFFTLAERSQYKMKSPTERPLEVFKNVRKVFINQIGNLVLNVHELHMNEGHHIKLSKSGFLTKSVEARYDGEGAFVFADGSRVEMHPLGMIMLTSSDADIPTIYIPSVLDKSLGAATKNCFTGNTYYYKQDTAGNEIISPAIFYTKFIEAFISKVINATAT